jgi:hypothetical protein
MAAAGVAVVVMVVAVVAAVTANSNLLNLNIQGRPSFIWPPFLLCHAQPTATFPPDPDLYNQRFSPCPGIQFFY